MVSLFAQVLPGLPATGQELANQQFQVALVPIIASSLMMLGIAGFAWAIRAFAAR